MISEQASRSQARFQPRPDTTSSSLPDAISASDVNLSLPVELRARLAEHLLAWYRIHKRDLPWRGASPYGVWVSEIMLQQTQVATVIPFYRRFLERFPTVETLAAAPIEEVLKYWAGLGYYARARNLHRAAQMVAMQHGGILPNTPETIAALPGIGRYTSGAILSIAYNLPQPLVDANVIRVLSRVFGLRGDPKSTQNQATLWALAAQLVPAEAPGDFNQGLMELGALICEPADPKCEQCPLLADCVAGNSPDPSALPEFPPGRATVAVTHCSAIVRNALGQILIVQRPLHGLWGGLWEFPRVVCASGESPQEAAQRAAAEIAGLNVQIGARIGKVKHGVTHHRITLYGFEATLQERSKAQENRGREEHEQENNTEPQIIHEEQNAVSSSQILPAASIHPPAALRWVSLEELNDYAFSSPQALLREALLKQVVCQQSGTGQSAFAFED